jgi:hypothetical protein
MDLMPPYRSNPQLIAALLAAIKSTRSNGLIEIQTIRDKVPGWKRETIDTELLLMERDRLIQLMGDNNAEMRTPEERAKNIQRGLVSVRWIVQP